MKQNEIMHHLAGYKSTASLPWYSVMKVKESLKTWPILTLEDGITKCNI
jgi:hypothetical protein